MKSVSKSILWGLACAAALAPLAQAQSIVSRGQSFVRADLVPGKPMPDGDRMIGLALSMAPEWKTYWRSPGEAGIPPTIDWSGSQNVASTEVFWPRPEVFTSFGMLTIGYQNHVILPVRLTPSDPSAPIELDVSLDLGVCRDICVLETTQISAMIPVDSQAGADLVSDAMAQVPASGADQGMEHATCKITGAGSDRDFSASLVFDQPITSPMVLLEGPEGVWFHRTETVASDTQIDVASKLSILFDDVWVSRKDVRMTVLADNMAADIRGCEAPVAG
ncbi:MAG: protein-disulfide reductase DsbD domain-containing protein [Pseudomonadota bacterium]